MHASVVSAVAIAVAQRGCPAALAALAVAGPVTVALGCHGGQDIQHVVVIAANVIVAAVVAVRLGGHGDAPGPAGNTSVVEVIVIVISGLTHQLITLLLSALVLDPNPLFLPPLTNMVVRILVVAAPGHVKPRVASWTVVRAPHSPIMWVVIAHGVGAAARWCIAVALGQRHGGTPLKRGSSSCAGQAAEDGPSMNGDQSPAAHAAPGACIAGRAAGSSSVFTGARPPG